MLALKNSDRLWRIYHSFPVNSTYCLLCLRNKTVTSFYHFWTVNSFHHFWTALVCQHIIIVLPDEKLMTAVLYEPQQERVPGGEKEILINTGDMLNEKSTDLMLIPRPKNDEPYARTHNTSCPSYSVALIFPSYKVKEHYLKWTQYWRCTIRQMKNAVIHANYYLSQQGCQIRELT